MGVLQAKYLSFLCLSDVVHGIYIVFNNWIVNLARGVAYVGSQTGEGRAQTGCGPGAGGAGGGGQAKIAMTRQGRGLHRRTGGYRSSRRRVAWWLVTLNINSALNALVAISSKTLLQQQHDAVVSWECWPT